MMQGYDNYKLKANDVFRLYLNGMEAGDIAGRTGVPRVRIEREIAYQTAKDPALLGCHLRARHRNPKKVLRWTNATLVISEHEKTESKNEY